jgi:hypothetical protein
MIRVLLAEDQAMVRGALAALLSLEDDIDVVAEVARGDEVVPTALTTRPDVALLDIEMPGGDGLSAAHALRTAIPALDAAAICGGRWRAGRSASCSRMRQRPTWRWRFAGLSPVSGWSIRIWRLRRCRKARTR